MTIAATGEQSDGATSARFAPDAYWAPMAKWFRRYATRKIAKSFFAVRLDRESSDLAGFDGRPVVMAVTHTSWWDPLLSLALHEAWFPGRRPAGPMDIDQLERFGFFRKLGIFGVDPHDPASMAAMGRHVGALYEREPDAALWITPQGEFADVRTELRVRPGVAAMAASLDNPVVIALAVEYAFWVDQKPEIFLHARRAELSEELGAEPSTTSWQRAVVGALDEARSTLASRVAARDPEPFEIVIGKGEAKTIPLWDTVMKLRGHSGSIEAKRRGAGS